MPKGLILKTTRWTSNYRTWKWRVYTLHLPTKTRCKHPPKTRKHLIISRTLSPLWQSPTKPTLRLIPTYRMATSDQYHSLAPMKSYKTTRAISHVPSSKLLNSLGKETYPTEMATQSPNSIPLETLPSTSFWLYIKQGGTNSTLRITLPSVTKSKINSETNHQLIRRNQKTLSETSLLASPPTCTQNKSRKPGKDYFKEITGKTLKPLDLTLKSLLRLTTYSNSEMHSQPSPTKKLLKSITPH